MRSFSWVYSGDTYMIRLSNVNSLVFTVSTDDPHTGTVTVVFERTASEFQYPMYSNQFDTFRAIWKAQGY